MSKTISNSLLLRIGAVGFLLGFAIWAVAVESLLFPVIFHGPFGIGSRSVSWATSPFFYFPLGVSYALSSFACFGLKRKYGSTIAPYCGTFYLFVASVLWYTIINLHSLYPYFFFFYGLPLVGVSQILWGATAFKAKKTLESTLSSMASEGSLFLGVLSLLWWDILLYLGFMFWLIAWGWLQAIISICSAILLVRLASNHQSK